MIICVVLCNIHKNWELEKWLHAAELRNILPIFSSVGLNILLSVLCLLVLSEQMFKENLCSCAYLWTSFSLYPLLIALSISEFLQWDIRAWASLGPEARHPGFWPGSSPGRELKDRRKKQWENVPRNPLHSLPENLLNIWPVLTVFIGLILGTEKI